MRKRVRASAGRGLPERSEVRFAARYPLRCLGIQRVKPHRPLCSRAVLRTGARAAERVWWLDPHTHRVPGWCAAMVRAGKCARPGPHRIMARHPSCSAIRSLGLPGRVASLARHGLAWPA